EHGNRNESRPPKTRSRSRASRTGSIEDADGSTELSPGDILLRLRAAKSPELAQALAKTREAGIAEIRQALAEDATMRLVAEALIEHPLAQIREDLERVVLSPDQVAAYHAARALGSIADSRSLDVLASRLATKPRRYWELAHRTGDGYRPVFERIRDGRDETIFAGPEIPNLRVARAAMEALGVIPGPEARAVLEDALASEQHLVRYGAVLGLARKGAEATELLEKVADDDPVLYVRRAARR